jgi:hypothetical protein
MYYIIYIMSLKNGLSCENCIPKINYIIYEDQQLLFRKSLDIVIGVYLTKYNKK